MKNCKYILIPIFLIIVTCFSFCACDFGSDNTTITSQPEISSSIEEQANLIVGDFKPKEEQIVTFEKALDRYGDAVLASFHSSRSREAYLVPRTDEEIEKIRISIPKRGILLPDTSDSGFEDDAEIYQMYYGYYSNGLWHDYPAENYELRTLHEPDSGFSDGWKALCGHHIVKIGPYVLLAFIDILENTTIEDVLCSEVLILSSDKTTSETPYLIFENVFNRKDEHITMEYRRGAFLLLEYDKLSTDYFVTIREYHPLLEGYSETVYTYDDLVEALNRK